MLGDKLGLAIATDLLRKQIEKFYTRYTLLLNTKWNPVWLLGNHLIRLLN